MERVETAPRISLRWIIRLRWLAVAGQATAILASGWFLRQPLHHGALLAVCGGIVAFNAAMQLWLDRGAEPGERGVGLNLLFDVGALSGLLLLSGGSSNPFSVLLLVHITIAAVIQPGVWILIVGGAAACCYSAIHLLPLPPLQLLGAQPWELHERGAWVAFLVAAAFISVFTYRMGLALRRREEELTHLRQDADAAERFAALGTLAAATAHQLNTPLGTIAILAGELSAQLQGEQRVEVDQIRAQVKRCKEIITGMLSPSPAGGAGDDEEERELDLPRVVEEVVRKWGSGRPGDLPQLELPPEVRGARVQLPLQAFEQGLYNLLDNAAEATEGREQPVVTVSLERDREDLRLRVADNGVGVPEPLRHRLGEPFFTTKGPGRGNGLGLYFVRHLLERHGGRLSVQSREGRGTSITLTIPELHG